MTVFDPAPVVVGHRGAGERIVSGFAENTIESCLEAHACGAAWVELDARLTADDALVLHHDDVLPEGRPIEEATLAQARREGVETLDEVMAVLPPELGVDLEVKVALRDATVDARSSTAGRVAARAAALRDQRPVLLTSFNPAALLQARAVGDGAVPMGLLGLPITPLRELVPAAVALGARVIAPHVLTTGIVEVTDLPVDGESQARVALDTARALGLETLVWGVRPAQVAELAGLGVAAVCVDEVTAAVTAVASVDGGR